MQGQAVFVAEAVRTPFGKMGGALASSRPDDLAALVLSTLVDRLGETVGDRERVLASVDEVVLGAANQAGEDNRNVGRMAGLLAGLPVSVPGVTVNRLCASGLEAVVHASRSIAVGDADLVLAGGAESMTRAPWVLPKPDRAFPAAHAQMWSTTLGWRMTNPRLRAEWTVSLGAATEDLAAACGIGRDESDAYAARSHRLAAEAWASGEADDVVSVPDSDLRRDECVRDEVDVESLGRLRTVFRTDGIVTAGNASPLNDGAAGVVLASEKSVEGLGLRPLARVVASASHGVEPQSFGLGPVGAVRRAVARAGVGLEDLETVEINEAFAAQVLACLRQLRELDPERVNARGGAIAIGHPLAASGSRLVGSVARRLAGRPGATGVASLCIGVGQGQALVLQGV
jgi:acetyl-CoA acetyltransferase family protein